MSGPVRQIHVNSLLPHVLLVVLLLLSVFTNLARPIEFFPAKIRSVQIAHGGDPQKQSSGGSVSVRCMRCHIRSGEGEMRQQVP